MPITTKDSGTWDFECYGCESRGSCSGNCLKPMKDFPFEELYNPYSELTGLEIMVYE
jgi:hypothetical protein